MIHKNSSVEQVNLVYVLCRLNFGDSFVLNDDAGVVWKGSREVHIMHWPWAYSDRMYSSDKKATQ